MVLLEVFQVDVYGLMIFTVYIDWWHVLQLETSLMISNGVYIRSDINVDLPDHYKLNIR